MVLEIDRENINTSWRDVICEEMKNVHIVFEEFDRSGVPIGYKKIDCHMIFDVKLGGKNYQQKVRLLVAGGHKTEAPTSITPSSVVS